MAAPSIVVKLLDALASAAAAVRTLPKLAAQWLATNVAKVMAVAWLGGLATFGYTTVQRARALRAAEAAADAPKTAEEKAKAAEEAKAAAQPEVVAMLDVDEMNQIRADRMHANGLEAAGDEGAPDLATIEEARERRKNGVKVEGEIAGQAGGVVVVTKGGIKGWLSRNKGKKADPDTLAWLRQEEAAEGRKAYAGWADREDGSILNYAKEEKKNGTLGVGAGSKNDLAAIENGGVDPNGPRPDEPAAGSATTGALTTTGSSTTAVATTTGTTTTGATTTAPTTTVPTTTAPTTTVPTTIAPTTTAAPTTDVAPTTTAPTTTPAPTTAVVPAARVAQLDMHALGEAARTALTTASKRQPDADPTPDEIAAVKKRLEPITSQLRGAGITTIVREHHIVLVLVADQLFAAGEESLSPTGKRVVRNLALALRGTPNTNFRLAIDPDRAMEMAATLVVGGMDADRLDVSLREQVDRAIDIIEIVLIPTDYGDAPEERAK